MPIEESPYFTPKEAAEYLKISLRTLDRWVAAFSIPYSPVTKKRRYFRKTDLDRFLDSRRNNLVWQEMPKKKTRHGNVFVPPGFDCTRCELPPRAKKALGIK